MKISARHNGDDQEYIEILADRLLAVYMTDGEQSRASYMWQSARTMVEYGWNMGGSIYGNNENELVTLTEDVCMVAVIGACKLSCGCLVCLRSAINFDRGEYISLIVLLSHSRISLDLKSRV